MATIADIRRQFADIVDGLDDEQVIDAVHMAFYADLPRDLIAGALGDKESVSDATPLSAVASFVPSTSRSTGRTIADALDAGTPAASASDFARDALNWYLELYAEQVLPLSARIH